MDDNSFVFLSFSGMFLQQQQHPHDNNNNRYKSYLKTYLLKTSSTHLINIIIMIEVIGEFRESVNW
ncbi:hypothetical protein DERF_014359 [Dermatophagoides farinae]|uniref:Uncharacterized protein n=1 Tax=Dermatophagoides farinae TaxID=6954 RepID=A0A922HM29_DERFA|nr:hypothetical protein DERF_014359 [Dermatophagoides farinae]